jgi:molybdenum-dependent DNA-binding transcriptional regulator ModE
MAKMMLGENKVDEEEGGILEGETAMTSNLNTLMTQIHPTTVTRKEAMGVATAAAAASPLEPL